MKKIAFILIIAVLSVFLPIVRAQTNLNQPVFGKIELIVPDGENMREQSVRVRFLENAVQIETEKGSVLKTFNNADIKSAEYSYSKNPRWKTGLGLGAAGILFPPLWFVALPLGFSKHRRHWITIRTEKDFAVLKIGKSVRKIFIPAFETQTGVRIEAVGENK